MLLSGVQQTDTHRHTHTHKEFCIEYIYSFFRFFFGIGYYNILTFLFYTVGLIYFIYSSVC